MPTPSALFYATFTIFLVGSVYCNPIYLASRTFRKKEKMAKMNFVFMLEQNSSKNRKNLKLSLKVIKYILTFKNLIY